MLRKGLLLLANLEIRLLLLIWALHHIGNCFQGGLWCVDLAQKAVLSGVKGNGSVPLIFQLSCLFCPLEPQFVLALPSSVDFPHFNNCGQTT